ALQPWQFLRRRLRRRLQHAVLRKRHAARLPALQTSAHPEPPVSPRRARRLRSGRPDQVSPARQFFNRITSTNEDTYAESASFLGFFRRCLDLNTCGIYRAAQWPSAPQLRQDLLRHSPRFFHLIPAEADRPHPRMPAPAVAFADRRQV